MRLAVLLLPPTLILVAAVSGSYFHDTTFQQQQHQQQKQLLEMSGNSGNSGDLLLSDVLGRDKTTAVFCKIIRDVPSVSEIFGVEKNNFTLLIPTNSKVMDLPHKPWEAPSDYQAFGTNAYEGQDGQDRAQKTLLNFVSAHVVPHSPLKVNDKVSTLNGNQLWVEEENGKKIVGLCYLPMYTIRAIRADTPQIKPDGVEVTEVSDSVSNGEIWVIGGVLKYN